jgi:hypothetical protein
LCGRARGSLIDTEMGIYESSGRSYTDPIGAVALLTGFAGAVLSVALWVERSQPGTSLFGTYGRQLANGGPLASQVAVLAAVLGTMALLLGIVSGMGGRARLSTSLAIVLGLLALSYPVLTALNIVTSPLRPHLMG